MANVLVQNGTLHVGDVVLAGNHFGKVKAMFNERNQRIKEAGPATPALILGLNGAPQAGDTFNVLETEQEARDIAGKARTARPRTGSPVPPSSSLSRISADAVQSATSRRAPT